MWSGEASMKSSQEFKKLETDQRTNHATDQMEQTALLLPTAPEVKTDKDHPWESPTITKTEELTTDQKKSNKLLNKMKTEEATTNIQEVDKETSRKWEVTIETWEEVITVWDEMTLMMSSNSAKIKTPEEITSCSLLIPIATKTSSANIRDKTKKVETATRLLEMIEPEARVQPVKRVLNLLELLPKLHFFTSLLIIN